MNDPFKKVSPAALIALKEALAVIYWYKKDIRSFISYTIKNNAMVSTIDWQNSVKYHAVSELVDRMAARPDLYHDDLLGLFREVANFTDFSHLKRCRRSGTKNPCGPGEGGGAQGAR